MDKRERFYKTIHRESVDRPAFWLGLPTDAALPALLKHFGAKDFQGLKKIVDDDIWTVICPYHSPVSDLIEDPFKFSMFLEHTESSAERTLTQPGFFAGMEDPSEIDRFDWPDPAQYIDREAIRRQMAEAPKDRAIMGVLWASHFQLAFEAFGMEDALITMKLQPECFEAVINRITEFYLQANQIFLEETKGQLDAILIGNDFGTQNGLMTSPEDLREFVFSGTRQMIEQAHSYGVTVVHHSCGSVFDVIPDLIACGADVIHPIQALARNMEPERLKENFGNQVAFCGGLDAQELLVNGTPDAVYQRASELLDLFPTGLVLSPSHEAILPDVPVQNVEAMVRAVRDRG